MNEKLRRRQLGALLGAALVLLGMTPGCAPSLEGNKPRDARRAVPKDFSAASGVQSTVEHSIAQQTWAKFFDDPNLRELIESAVANNQELNVKLQEIIIAQTEVSARQGDYLPKVNAGAGVGMEKAGRYTRNGTVDAANGLSDPVGNFTFGLMGSWEVDVWSKLRNAAKSADYRYLASIEGRNFFVTQLVAEIARSYYELIGLDRRIEILERNIATQTDALEVVKAEKEAARVTQLAVQRFEAEVLKNRSRRFDLEQARVQAENRINFLVGRYPQQVPRDPAQLDAMVPESVPLGVPSRLLENRPDVKQAELQLEASKLDVAATKAAFYPSLTIDAGVGYEAFNVEHLVTTPESIFYNTAGHLVMPLLNRRGIEAAYRSANARQIQAVFSFERTLLEAFTDVANQLAALSNLRKAVELQSQQVAILDESVEASGILFQAARADYMEVLLTRRDSLDAQMELLETKKRLRTAVVNVYQALGGGWRSQK